MSNDNNGNVKLTRSEAREQAFMLLFSELFDNEPLEATIEDKSQMFKGGICGYAQAVVSGIEDKKEFKRGLDAFKNFKAFLCNFAPGNL